MGTVANEPHIVPPADSLPRSPRWALDPPLTRKKL